MAGKTTSDQRRPRKGNAVTGGKLARPQPSEGAWAVFKRRSGVSDPRADAALPDPASVATRGASRLPLVLLCSLYVFAVAVYVLLGSRQALPQVAPDEYQYSALARSLADGNGLTYNGGSIGIRAALYLYVISFAWRITDSLTASYAIAKGMGAAMLCTIVFPTWLLARRYVTPMVALVPAGMIVAGSWMTSGGQLIMENLALPLATASLAALVVALARPGSRLAWASLGFAVLATASRAQLAVLIPIILAGFVVDVLAQGHGWRERLRLHRWPLAVVLVMSVVGGIVVLADPSVLGSYVDLTGESNLSRGLPLVKRQALIYIAMAAVLPFVVALAATFRARAWEERRLRALLIVFWVATVGFVLESGILTSAFITVTWGIQRYVEYTLPLLYVLAVAAIWTGLVSRRLFAAATAIVALVLLATPAFQNIQEQRSVFGILRRSDQLLGLTAGPTMALLTLVLGGLVLLAVGLMRTRDARAVMLTTLVALTGCVFVVQNQAGWNWQIEQSRVWRKGFPRDLSWIDNATNRPLARLVSFYNPYRTPQTEFFNRRITRTYSPGTPVGGAPVNGFTCRWRTLPSGALVFSTDCGPQPTAFFLNDDLAKYTFYDQKVVAQEPDIGRIVAVDVKPPARVRVKAVVNPPCTAAVYTQNPKTGEINPPAATCGGGTAALLNLDRPGRVVLRFRGGQSDQHIQVRESWRAGDRVVAVPARGPLQIVSNVPSGFQRLDLGFDWLGAPPAVPALTSVTLRQGGKTTELLY